jgi:jasmonic acid-amino synthetase
MSKLLNPNPELADSVCRKCSGLSNWYGLIPALFPNVKYIYGTMTGSMEPYLKKLRHYAGDLPLLSADYGASEGWIAANVNPKVPTELTTYVVLPNIGYFEFIPVRDSIEFKPVGLTEVKLGEEYEVVVTNFAGTFLI